MPEGMSGVQLTPTAASRARVDALIELVLGFLALATFVLVSLGVRGGPEPVLALAFLLFVIRVRRNGEGDPTRRPGLRPGTWLGRLRGPDLLLVGTFLVLVGVLHEDGGRLEVDGPLLYMQVRSLVIDHDLDYTNEFAEFVPERFQHWAEEARRLGRPPDPPVEPGPALLWMPFFVLAHGLVLLARLRGSALLADGYGVPYVNAVCLGSLVWAFVGVMLTARLCRRWFSPMLAATCTAGAWLAMPLLWYSVFEPTMPHGTATAAVALFLWQWLRVRDQPECRLRWLALAFAGGLLVSMERYDAYFFVGPALTALALFWNRRRALDRATLRRLLGTAGVLAVVFLIATLPLLVTNLSSRHQSVIAETNLLGFTFRNWAHPYLAEVLFSSRHGLFSWTPVAYLGVVGLALFGRREPRLAAALGLTLAFGLYLFAASWGWDGAWSFGSRRFTEAFPVFVLGLCAVGELLLARPGVLGTLALAGFVAWNVLLAGQVRRGEVPRDDTVSFSDTASRAVQRAYELVGHPSAFPASWIFALRYRVPPDRFDAVFGREAAENVVIPVGTPSDIPYLGRGWSLAESSPSARWSLGGESTLLVPLSQPLDRILRVRARASRHPAGLPQTVGVEINGRRAGQWSFSSRSEERALEVPAAFWRRGLNEIRFVYAWTVVAGEAYRGSDPRRVAWRVEEVELRDDPEQPYSK